MWQRLNSRIRTNAKTKWDLHLPGTMTGIWQDAKPWPTGWTAFLVVVTLVSLSADMVAATKPHVIVFGKWSSVPWPAGSGDHRPSTLKIRPLIVDGRIREYVAGSPHEITDRLFVVRRAFRINDSLPDDQGSPKWQWERGGWMLVNRISGRISAINLPEFDNFYSAASWFRDYVAYCGVSDDGQNVHAVVAQIGRRKPVLKAVLTGVEINDDAEPDSACAPPKWQRSPVRASFESPGAVKQTFAIRGRAVDVVSDNEDEEGSK